MKTAGVGGDCQTETDAAGFAGASFFGAVERRENSFQIVVRQTRAVIADDEVEKYQVVRIADAIVVDLLKSACGVDYARAADGGIEFRTVDGVPIAVGRNELLIETKQTVRPSDAADVQFLRVRIAAERGTTPSS